jgi:hypothetical protein
VNLDLHSLDVTSHDLDVNERDRFVRSRDLLSTGRQFITTGTSFITTGTCFITTGTSFIMTGMQFITTGMCISGFRHLRQGPRRRRGAHFACPIEGCYLGGVRWGIHVALLAASAGCCIQDINGLSTSSTGISTSTSASASTGRGGTSAGATGTADSGSSTAGASSTGTPVGSSSTGGMSSANTGGSSGTSTSTAGSTGSTTGTTYLPDASCNPNVTSKQFDGCGPSTLCGCPYHCVDDPFAELVLFENPAIEAWLCEQACGSNEDCNSILTGCSDAHNCAAVRCGGGSGNGFYNSTCSMGDGQEDGTCLVISDSVVIIDAGICQQAGTATGTCDDGPVTRSDLVDVCEPGYVCTAVPSASCTKLCTTTDDCPTGQFCNIYGDPQSGYCLDAGSP